MGEQQKKRTAEELRRSILRRASAGDTAMDPAKLREIIGRMRDVVETDEPELQPLSKVLIHQTQTATATAATEQDLDPMDLDAKPDMPRSLIRLNFLEAVHAIEHNGAEIREDGSLDTEVTYYTPTQSASANDDAPRPSGP